MNKPNDSLFRLIHSLNTVDKDHISQYLKENKQRNHYLNLYDFILNAKRYSDKIVMEQLSIKRSVLPVVKHELYEKILFILLQKNNERSVFFELHDKLNKIELLFNLGQHEEAFTFCMNVIEIAKKHDLPAYILIANRWRMMAVSHTANNHLGVKMEEIAEEQERVTTILSSDIAVHKFYVTVVSRVMNNLQIRSKAYIAEFNNFLQDELLIKNPDDFSFYSKNKLYMTKTFIYLALAQYENAYNNEIHVWKGLKADFDSMAVNKTIELRNAMINYANTVQLSNRTDEMQEIISYYKIQLNKFPALSPYLADYMEMYKLIFLLKNNNKETLSESLTAFIQYYEQKTDKSLIELNKTFQLIIAISFYKLKQYDDSLKWLSEIYLQYHASIPRLDIIENSKLLYILVYFEKIIHDFKKSKLQSEFYTIVKSYYDSIRRKDKDEDYSLEILISKALQKIKPTHNNEKKTLALISLKNQMMQLIEANIPYILHINANFNLITWIDNCINILKKKQAH